MNVIFERDKTFSGYFLGRQKSKECKMKVEEQMLHITLYVFVMM